LARSKLAEGSVIGVGHRVVHGGLKYASPVRITETVLGDLTELIPLAPLHEPHAIAPMRAIMKADPQLPQVACSTPPSTAASRLSRRRSPCRAGSMPKAFAAMGSMASLTSTSCRA
jgi:hypothetical protein